jgi:hypothetical protein
VFGLTHCKDNTNVQHHFQGIGKAAFSDLEVEYACHKLFAVLIQRCRTGFRGLPKNNILITPKGLDADKTANCGTRFQNVLNALWTWKPVCKNMIETDDKKWELVNAPLSLMVKKDRQKNSNDFKRIRKDELVEFKSDTLQAASGKLGTQFQAQVQAHLSRSSAPQPHQQHAPELHRVLCEDMEPSSALHAQPRVSFGRYQTLSPGLLALGSAYATQHTYTSPITADPSTPKGFPGYDRAVLRMGQGLNGLGMVESSALPNNAPKLVTHYPCSAAPYNFSLDHGNGPEAPGSSCVQNRIGTLQAHALLPSNDIQQPLPPLSATPSTTNHGESVQSNANTRTDDFGNHYYSPLYDNRNYYYGQGGPFGHSGGAAPLRPAGATSSTNVAQPYNQSDVQLRDGGNASFAPIIDGHAAHAINQPPQTPSHGSKALAGRKRAREEEEAQEKRPRLDLETRENGKSRHNQFPNDGEQELDGPNHSQFK